MKKVQKPARLIAAVLLPALFATACSHGGGSLLSSSVPGGNHDASGGTRHTRGVSTADLYGGGATFPFVAYTGNVQPVGSGTGTQSAPDSSSLFGAAPTTNNVYYCATGSGYGKGVFIGSNAASGSCAALGASATGFGSRDTTADFAGSDAALKTTEYSTYVTNEKTNHAEPFEFPAIGGSITFAYVSGDMNGVGGVLKLSKTSYCKIAAGTITNWNDSQIQSDNGGTYPVDTTKPPADGTSFTAGAAGQSVAIKNFYYRSDSSGTSLLFQNHLHTVCGTLWPGTVGTTWGGPMTSEFVGKNGNPGIAAAIQGAHYSTGYLEAGYLSYGSPSLAGATLQNSSGNYESPTNSTALASGLATITLANTVAGGSDDNAGGSTVDLGTSRKDCVFYINPSKFANPSGSGAYPIVGVSYLDFYGKGYTRSSSDHTSDVKALAKYMLGADSPDDRPAAPTGYAYITDSSLKTELQAAYNGTAASSSFKDVNGNSVTRTSSCMANS